MCESSPTPLARLSEACAECLRQRQHEGCEACRELAYRALCDGNDAAWDLLLVHLWPYLLRAIYALQPEASPARSQELGYRALLLFRRRCANQGDLATNFPTFPALLLLLHQCLLEVAARP
jgi:hypothetical protein